MSRATGYIIKICEECGKDYRIYLNISSWNRKRRKFCSKSCAGKNSPTKFKNGHKVARPFAKGENNPNWHNGSSSKSRLIRESPEYKEWRRAVFERDNYKCVECGIHNNKLAPDHIKPFAIFEDLRFDINNGKTLCQECHRKTPTFGINFHRMNITKDNYEEWLTKKKSDIL